jgi:hypothetical protein
MKTTKNSKLIKNKDLQEFNYLWEKAQKELPKKAKSPQEKLFADFLTNNYLDSKSGLITNKQHKENSSLAC